MGDRLPVLFREVMLPWEGVEWSESFKGGGLAGIPGTGPVIELRLLFLFDGGMRAEGRRAGMGSFSRARYTRCMACRERFRVNCNFSKNNNQSTATSRGLRPD